MSRTRPKVPREHVEWRYLRGGLVRHALSAPVGGRDEAVCGTHLWPGDDWYGTGTQDEYERVAALPECQRCTRRLTPLAEVVNTR